MHVYCRHEGFGRTEKPYSDPGGENFRKTIEPKYSSNFGKLKFEREVRRDTGSGSIIKVVIGIVFKGK